MLLLFETPAGYSLFKVKDEDKLKDIDVRLSLFVLLLLLLFFCDDDDDDACVLFSRRQLFVSWGQLTNSLSLSLSLSLLDAERNFFFVLRD